MEDNINLTKKAELSVLLGFVYRQHIARKKPPTNDEKGIRVFFEERSKEIGEKVNKHLQNCLSNEIVFSVKMSYLFSDDKLRKEEEKKFITSKILSNESVFTVSDRQLQLFYEQGKNPEQRRTIFCIAVYLGYEFDKIEDLYVDFHKKTLDIIDKQEKNTQTDDGNNEKEDLKKQLTELHQQIDNQKQAIADLKTEKAGFEKQKKQLTQKNKWLMNSLIFSCLVSITYIVWYQINHTTPILPPPDPIEIKESNFTPLVGADSSQIQQNSIAENPIQVTKLELATTQLQNNEYFYDKQNYWTAAMKVDAQKGEDATGFYGVIGSGDYDRSRQEWNYNGKKGCINIAYQYLSVRLTFSNKTQKTYNIKNIKTVYDATIPVPSTSGYASYSDRGSASANLCSQPTSKEIVIPKAEHRYIKVQTTPETYPIVSAELKPNTEVNFFVKLQLNDKLKGCFVRFKIAIEVWENNDPKTSQWIESDKFYLIGLNKGLF